MSTTVQIVPGPISPPAVAPVKVPPNHYLFWDDATQRKDFLLFFCIYIVWAAFDIAFDVLFAFETFRILQIDVPNTFSLSHFFPATVVCLLASMLLTMYANIPLLRRVVLISSLQHEEESQGNSRLVWEDFPLEAKKCFRVFVDAVLIIFQDSKWRAAGGGIDKAKLQEFLFAGPSTLLSAVIGLLMTIPLLLRNIVSLATLSTTGKWELFDKLDNEFMFPPIFKKLNTDIVQMCAGAGVSVEFCNSGPSDGDEGYLVWLNAFVMRPLASFFNFATKKNPTADINVSDPRCAGYLERVMRWWGNYERWEKNSALSFFTYIPLVLLLVTLPALQIVASLIVALFHFIAMMLQLLSLPLLLPLGQASTPSISFCKAVKYSTGAFCIFSDNLPGLKIQKSSADLSRYSADCRGIGSLHALHESACEIKHVPEHCRVAFALFGIFYYPVRGIMLSLVTLVICSPLCWAASFAAHLCLGLAQVCAFVVAVTAYVAYATGCTLVFLLVLALLTAWFLVSMAALIGMELLCFISAMTNPEVGLILYDNVDERRYKLGAAAGFIEDFPGFILQALYTHMMGTRGTAGTSRAISLTLSSWRMFVLTVKRCIKFRMIAEDKRDSLSDASESWEDERRILANSHGTAKKIMLHFRSSLFPDMFSALLRCVIFAAYAGLFGWLASQNVFTQQGFSAFLDSNFPVPNICPQAFSVTFCNTNANCQSGVCVCNYGWAGDGVSCVPDRPVDVSFSIAPSDRRAGKTAVPATLGFTPFYPIPSGGTITLSFPSGFFAPSITPTVAAGSSSVGGLTGTCSATTATAVVITTAGAAIPASAFVVTMTGFTMGNSTAGGLGVAVQTSTDLVPSVALVSGAIFGPGDKLLTLTHSDVVSSVAWSPDGTKIATASYDRTARVWSSSSGSTLLTLTGHSTYVTSVAWSPDGTKIATASYDRTARVWSSSSGSTLLTLTGHSSSVLSVAWSPDGTKIATASEDRTARVWSSSGGSTLLTLTGHSSSVLSVAWSPDGTKIATASEDRTARVWSSSGGSALLTLTGHSSYVFSVAWSPDGTKIATASYDRTARVWSSSGGSTLLTLTGHSSSVLSVAWSPDGTEIATASYDRTARVWSSSGGSTLLTLTGHSSSVLSVAWSPDGTKIATASEDRTARIWLV